MLARSGMLVLVLGGICALSAAPLAPAAPGDLDSTFGGDGSVATDVGGERYPVRKRLQDVALQADGKIVVAGWVGEKAGFAVARYEPDGTLDPDFAGDGVAITRFGGASSAAEGVAIQADGRIVAAGYAGGSFALVRYRRNGKLDSSFGGDGKVKTDLTRWDDYALDVAVQTNGKVVAGGRSAGHGGRFGLARYRPNGTLDSTFSGDGRQTLNLSAGDDIARALAIQPNGKIVAAGSEFGNDLLERGRFALARFNPSGALDFDTTTDFGTPRSDEAQGVALQADGKIVVAGSAGSAALARYETNGVLDATFDGDGRLTTPGFSVNDIAIQADGRIVVVGHAGDAFVVARYDVGGALDGTFGAGGIVPTNLGNDEARWTIAEGVAIQPNGRIIAGGTQADGRSRYVVARFLAE